MRISDWSSDVCSSDLAQATREALALAVRRLGAVRALAAPTVTADFFDSLEVVEQAGWTQNFLQRCTYDFTANSGYVTLLDTGVSRAHPLIKTALAAADRNAANPAWGLEDVQLGRESGGERVGKNGEVPGGA